MALTSLGIGIKFAAAIDSAHSLHAQAELKLAQAAMLGDRGHADGYAQRVGRETVRTFDDALDQANDLLSHGLGDHLEATATCVQCPLMPAVIPGGTMVTTVGVNVVAALASSREHGLELRAPPDTWTSAPPLQLFEPVMSPRVAAHFVDG